MPPVPRTRQAGQIPAVNRLWLVANQPASSRQQVKARNNLAKGQPGPFFVFKVSISPKYFQCENFDLIKKYIMDIFQLFYCSTNMMFFYIHKGSNAKIFSPSRAIFGTETILPCTLCPCTKRPERYFPRFYVSVRFISERVTTNRTPPTHGFAGHLA